MTETLSKEEYARRYHLAPKLYDVQRIYFNRPGYKRTILERVTLEQAQAHCSDPETSSRTCTNSAGRARTRRLGPWFDSYVER